MRSTCGTIVKATAGAPNQSCMTQDAQKAMVNGQHRQVPIKKEAPPPVPCLCLGGTSISSEYIFYIEGTLYMVCYIFIFGVIYLSVRRWPSWKQYSYMYTQVLNFFVWFNSLRQGATKININRMYPVSKLLMPMHWELLHIYRSWRNYINIYNIFYKR